MQHPLFDRCQSIQSAVFNRSQEDVIASIVVTQMDVSAPKQQRLLMSMAKSHSDTIMELVLTVNRSSNGYSDPMLHHLKVRPTSVLFSTFKCHFLVDGLSSVMQVLCHQFYLTLSTFYHSMYFLHQYYCPHTLYLGKRNQCVVFEAVKATQGC